MHHFRSYSLDADLTEFYCRKYDSRPILVIRSREMALNTALIPVSLDETGGTMRLSVNFAVTPAPTWDSAGRFKGLCLRAASWKVCGKKGGS